MFPCPGWWWRKG